MLAQELCQRTGKSPNFKYLQIGCSRASEQAMLRFAMQQQKKPFSMKAMVRSIFWPRKTDYKSYFCAGTPSHNARKPLQCRDHVRISLACPQSSWRRHSRRAG